MPEIAPPEYNVNPVGRFPLANDHVIGAVPVAASCALYAVPVLPLGKVVVVIVGFTAEVVIAMDSALVSLPALLVAFTVKLEVPAEVGVPDITPAVERLNPAGRLPLANDHVMGVVPVAASVALYAVPVTPPGNVVVVMVGFTVAALITMLSVLVSLPTLLLAFTVKLEVPAVVGVPEITPAPERLKPVGSVPFSNDHVIGAVPVAVSC